MQQQTEPLVAEVQASVTIMDNDGQVGLGFQCSKDSYNCLRGYLGKPLSFCGEAAEDCDLCASVQREGEPAAALFPEALAPFQVLCPRNHCCCLALATAKHGLGKDHTGLELTATLGNSAKAYLMLSPGPLVTWKRASSPVLPARNSQLFSDSPCQSP